MLGAVAMQHFRASPRQVLVPLSSAPSQHARQVGRDCAIAQIQRINLSSSVAASLSSTPSTEPTAAAHPLLMPLPLPPMPTVATHKQRQRQYGELYTYTLARTVGIGVCLLCDKPLGDGGEGEMGRGAYGNIPPIVRQRKGRG
jgi:FtsP/CotA-like multicopper oxidase with cupredoxin domain